MFDIMTTQGQNTIQKAIIKVDDVDVVTEIRKGVKQNCNIS